MWRLASVPQILQNLCNLIFLEPWLGKLDQNLIGSSSTLEFLWLSSIPFWIQYELS